jgi:hypothetical protein
MQAILFHVKSSIEVGKAAAETYSMLHEACRDDALRQMTTYKWFKCFKNGSTSRDDHEQSG